MPQFLVASSHQIDHVIAEKHGGQTSQDNLALSCSLCNLRKGSDIATLSPDTGELVRLFSPREHYWREHFRIDGGKLIGLTEIGKATVHFLQLNSIERATERVELAKAGVILDAHLNTKPR